MNLLEILSKNTPAAKSSESPGKKKPTNNPVSANTTSNRIYKPPYSMIQLIKFSKIPSKYICNKFSMLYLIFFSLRIFQLPFPFAYYGCCQCVPNYVSGCSHHITKMIYWQY